MLYLPSNIFNYKPPVICLQKTLNYSRMKWKFCKWTESYCFEIWGSTRLWKCHTWGSYVSWKTHILLLHSCQTATVSCSASHTQLGTGPHATNQFHVRREMDKLSSKGRERHGSHLPSVIADCITFEERAGPALRSVRQDKIQWFKVYLCFYQYFLLLSPEPVILLDKMPSFYAVSSPSGGEC